MSFNRILKKVPIGNITKGGKDITLSVAVETSNWNRPESIALQQASGFQKAVEASKHLIKEGTIEVCQREGQHVSDDERDHYTGVCFDEAGDGRSEHFPVKKE